VNSNKSALVALLLTATVTGPSAAQQASSTAQLPPSENCAECFAYLEFPPSREPESYAMRSGETPKSLPAEGEARDRLRKRTAGLRASSKQ
jgi:hypothetical protein